MICCLLLLLLPCTASLCSLNKWGLPLPSQDPTKVFSVPAIIPLSWYDGRPYYPGLHLTEAVLYTVSYLNQHVMNSTGFCLNTTIVDNLMLAKYTVAFSMQQVGRLTRQQQTSCPANQG